METDNKRHIKSFMVLYQKLFGFFKIMNNAAFSHFSASKRQEISTTIKAITGTNAV